MPEGWHKVKGRVSNFIFFLSRPKVLAGLLGRMEISIDRKREEVRSRNERNHWTIDVIYDEIAGYG